VDMVSTDDEVPYRRAVGCIIGLVVYADGVTTASPSCVSDGVVGDVDILQSGSRSGCARLVADTVSAAFNGETVDGDVANVCESKGGACCCRSNAYYRSLARIG
jgi:hypothetical protein